MTSLESADAYRLPFDPKCDRWTKFADLQLGDEVDYWGAARPIVDYQAFPDTGRVRIIVQGPNGQDMALAPDYEGTWRAPRADEGEQQ